MSVDPASIQAKAHLRAHREGVLIADGLVEKIRFIIDSATGRIVTPVMPGMLSAAELVLFVPEEEPEAGPELQLLLNPSEIDAERDFACDRWRAYHGEPRLTRWLACTIETARFAGQIVDVEPLNQPNPLARCEPMLCRMLNADRPRLANLCRAHAGIAPRDPLAVGVDDTGIDVRARFGIVRVGLPDSIPSCDEAERIIRSLLESLPA